MNGLHEYQKHALDTFGGLIAKYFHPSNMVELTDESRWIFGNTSKNFLCVQDAGGKKVEIGHPVYNRKVPHPDCVH